MLGQIYSVPKVIHITYNVGSCDWPSAYALSQRVRGPRASGICIRQIPSYQVTTYT